ncbi:MAG: DegT/DnrJ/EryC1/StrS family aminotransferase [Bacillota bacterium]
MAGYVGRKRAVPVNSGTSGLHLLVRALGIGEGDEVITTPFSFIASSNCILYERAKPVFVDIEPDIANIDPSLIEDAIISRYVIRVGVDEPTPERQSAVRDHVMRRFQEAGIGCRPYFTPIHLQPFYRAEFGFKEGDSPSPSSRGARASPSRSTTTSPPRRSTTSPASSSGRWGRCGSRRAPARQAASLLKLPRRLGYPHGAVTPRTEARTRPVAGPGKRRARGWAKGGCGAGRTAGRGARKSRFASRKRPTPPCEPASFPASCAPPVPLCTL